MAGEYGRKAAIFLSVLSITINLSQLQGHEDGVGAPLQLHHVVGGDRGWDPSSDLVSWSSDRTFRVGDNLWLAYSAAHGYIAEVKGKEEFESCDVSNPIRMFTDGLDSISMDQEGLRYFASSNMESCKNGLKLHVEVVPQSYKHPDMSPKPNMAEPKGVPLAAADGPTTPSGSAQLSANVLILISIPVFHLGWFFLFQVIGN